MYTVTDTKSDGYRVYYCFTCEIFKGPPTSVYLNLISTSKVQDFAALRMKVLTNTRGSVKAPLASDLYVTPYTLTNAVQKGEY